MRVPLLITGVALASPAGSALAAPPGAANPTQNTDTTAKLSEAFTILHAVNQTATNFSNMADTKAKSDLVKNYAKSMVTANGTADDKLTRVAAKSGIKIAPLDPKSEVGKSLQDRLNAETVLLNSLEGDAWDKEYMVLVTNTQQSVLRMLKANRATAKDKDVQQVLGDMIDAVQKRLNTSQDIMGKIYGDSV